MIITGLFTSKGGSEVTLECEDKSKYTITRADAKRLGLGEISDEDFPIEICDEEQLLFLVQKLKAIRYCSYLLGFSDKSENVLLRKLREKEYSPEVCREALAVLRQSGITNDENLCIKKYILLADSKKYGPSRLRSELYAKGFSQADIRNAEEKADIDFEDLLRELCEKLLSSGKYTLSDRKGLEKFKAKLYGYGYGFDLINSVMHEFESDEFEF